MRYDSHSGLRLEFRRTDGTPIRWMRWYDDQTHEWSAFRMDPTRAQVRGIPLENIVYGGRCPLVVLPVGDAPVAAKPEPPKIIPAAPSGRPIASTPRRVGIRLPEGMTQECETHGCHKRAVYFTNDFQETQPVQNGRYLYRTQKPTKMHFFCEPCFRLPLRVSLRGVTEEMQVGTRNEWKSL